MKVCVGEWIYIYIYIYMAYLLYLIELCNMSPEMGRFQIYLTNLIRIWFHKRIVILITFDEFTAKWAQQNNAYSCLLTRCRIAHKARLLALTTPIALDTPNSVLDTPLAVSVFLLSPSNHRTGNWIAYDINAYCCGSRAGIAP